jgi:hypothetical protein
MEEKTAQIKRPSTLISAKHMQEEIQLNSKLKNIYLHESNLPNIKTLGAKSYLEETACELDDIPKSISNSSIMQTASGLDDEFSSDEYNDLETATKGDIDALALRISKSFIDQIHHLEREWAAKENALWNAIQELQQDRDSFKQQCQDLESMLSNLHRSMKS